MSALDDMVFCSHFLLYVRCDAQLFQAPQFDDVDVLLREPLNLDPKMLILYKQGLKEAEKGRISYRKSRFVFFLFDLSAMSAFQRRLLQLRQRGRLCSEIVVSAAGVHGTSIDLAVAILLL